MGISSRAVAAENDARAKLLAGDAAAAVALLVEADRRCLAARIDYRCALLERALCEAQEKLGHADEKLALAALQRARASGFQPKDLPAELLHLLGRLASARGDEVMANAYHGEWLALP